MSAEVKLLRDAAALMRDRAQKATTGPWGVGNRTTVASEMEQLGPGHTRYRYWIADLDDFAREEADDSNPVAPEDDAKHIASWHPAVALAVAEWMERAAKSREAAEWAVAKTNADYPREAVTVDQIDLDSPFALAVARAYLGGVA